MSVVRVVGRWAELDNGDLVTAIPPFSEYETPMSMDRDIDRFQRDPEGWLKRYAVLHRIPKWVSSRRPAERDDPTGEDVPF